MLFSYFLSAQDGVYMLSGCYMLMSSIMSISCIWEYSNVPTAFTLLQLVVIFFVAATWTLAFISGFSGSLKLIKIVIEFWTVFLVGWTCTTVWLMFFANTSSLNDTYLCYDNRCITTMFIPSYKSPRIQSQLASNIIETIDFRENTDDREINNPTQQQKDKIQKTTSKSKRPTTRNTGYKPEIMDLNQKNLKIINHMKAMFQDGTPKILIVTMNGIPWLQIIFPLIFFALFLLGLHTLKVFKKELRDALQCVICNAK